MPISTSESETETVMIEGPGNRYVLTVSAGDRLRTSVFEGEREDLGQLAQELRSAAQHGFQRALVGLTFYRYKMRWYRLDPEVLLRRLDRLPPPVG